MRCGDGIYVRSGHGPENGWYRRARASGQGRIRAGGVERDVTFEGAGSSHSGVELDRAYHAKYDRYGPRIVGTVVSTAAARSTLRLAPK